MNVKIVENNIDAFKEELDKKASIALEMVGIEAEKYVSLLAPVDTGNLRNSITHNVDDGAKEVSIGSNVEYAPYQELGTRLIPAANGGIGYIRPGIEDHLSEYKSIIEDTLNS